MVKIKHYVIVLLKWLGHTQEMFGKNKKIALVHKLHNQVQRTYISPILLKFPNSAGRNPLSLFPLKFFEFIIQ